MSANSQSNHFWQLAENDLGYYQALANYYVSRNNGDHYAPHHASAFTGPTSFDYIPDPYLWDVYAAVMNYNTWYYNYNYHPTSEYVDDHVYVATDNQFPFIMSTYSQSRHLSQLAQHHLGYYQTPTYYHCVSRNIGDHYLTEQYFHDNYHAFTAPRHTYNGQSSFKYVEDPYLWDDGYNQLTCEFIDNVYDTNENEVINYHQAPTDYHYVLRNIDDHYFAPHNLDHRSAITDHGQSLFDHIEDPSLGNMKGNEDEITEHVMAIVLLTTDDNSYKQKFLRRRTYSEELMDAVEYNSTKSLMILNSLS
ncbi:hypothetical protein K7X08_009459 [Anisodus acutangulus]|uniref:Uncharacterized protein n=1 Tax=Anisodus acutangulus TaxID=402998 RepID=A0A9Q1RUT1_9SOLA|nr:hypothetical protein K7X08_009459 [Anisodus acutangulus]